MRSGSGFEGRDRDGADGGGAGRKAVAVQVDTTDEAANDAMVKRCVDALGAVDILVAAAGIGAVRVPGATSYQPHTVLSIPMEQFRRVIDVNLYGVLFSNRAVARWMTEHRRGGSIINLASIMSKMPSTSAPYSVSKAGVWMLTKCLAQELASAGHPRERDRPRLHRDADDGGDSRGLGALELGDGRDADGTLRQAGGDRLDGAVPGLGRCVLFHRASCCTRRAASSSAERVQLVAASAPPSTTISVPLIHAESSEARKRAQRAMSSGSPTRPSGI